VVPLGEANPQSLPHKKTGQALPGPHASRGSRKKSPSLATIGAICEAWLETRKAPRERVAGKTLRAIAGRLTVHELLPAHFEGITARWKDRHKRNTVCDYRAGLLTLARFIAATSGLHEIATFVPKVPSYRPRTTTIDPTDLAILLNAAPGWLRCAALLASHAGFRRSDVLRVAPIHYNAAAKTITITQAKTDHPVTVPVTETLAHVLDHAPEGLETTPYLELLAGKKIGKQKLWRAWTTLKKLTNAGTGVTSHDLRRTLAVSLYEVSKDLRVVEQMLGHQSLKSTIAYLEHRDPKKLRPYLDAVFIPKGRVQ
jgi:integrase